MKLLTKTLSSSLQKQWDKGADLTNQNVVAKFFNPSGMGTWYVISQDPNEPDMLYAIVDLFEVEVGMVSLSELEKIRTKPFNLPLERDLSWSAMRASEVLEGLLEGRHFANGGKVEVDIINKGKDFSTKAFSALLTDKDRDGIPNVDDPHPFKKGDKTNIDPEIKMAEVFKGLLTTRQGLDKQMKKVVTMLKNSAPPQSHVYARTKTPYSIIKKLIENRFINLKEPKRGLTDYIGTTITVDDYEEVQELVKKIRDGKFGEVFEEENHYAKPKNGYRAFHYVIWLPDHSGLYELQIKTIRQKELNKLSHPLYKNNNLNGHNMERLSLLVDKADKGDVKAAREIDELLSKPKEISELLAKDSKNITIFAKGGEVTAIENIFIIPEAAEEATNTIIDTVTP